ncbi:hypothetical protein CKAH01_18241 [Colletotrichum kahawae]|uniref:Uncharacterized protein n=1 Tax=Colletotrichum kahawae TaxID=34407 RepID=A0AAD9YAL4_COLKA|nr:hypothetical protein CKAH01_18241 [Colletotrichum kahawae]
MDVTLQVKQGACPPARKTESKALFCSALRLLLLRVQVLHALFALARVHLSSRVTAATQSCRGNTATEMLHSVCWPPNAQRSGPQCCVLFQWGRPRLVPLDGPTPASGPAYLISKRRGSSTQHPAQTPTPIRKPNTSTSTSTRIVSWAFALHHLTSEPRHRAPVREPFHQRQTVLAAFSSSRLLVASSPVLAMHPRIEGTDWPCRCTWISLLALSVCPEAPEASETAFSSGDLPSAGKTVPEKGSSGEMS